MRRGDGKTEEMVLTTGRVLGYEEGDLGLENLTIQLAIGETLLLYTDGFSEAVAPDDKTMFGVERLLEALGGPRHELSLQQCADEISQAVQKFTGNSDLQDDQTLLLLRRMPR